MTVGASGQHETQDRTLTHRAGRTAHAPMFAVLFACAAVAAAILTACTMDPGTIVRTPRENVGETSAKSRLAMRKGTQIGAPLAASGETANNSDTEVASLGVDLTNFKDRLMGLDSDEINDLMGTPDLERAEPPALIWQYRHQLCTVDIFMYDDGAGPMVDHVEVRPAGDANAGEKAAVSEKECFAALLRQAPQSGGPASAKATTTKPVAAPATTAVTAPGQQPIAPSPSMPVSRGSGATIPASTKPAAPSPDGEAGPAPEDTDVDFDFGGTPKPAAASGAAPVPVPPTADRLPSAAPSSEAIPTIPGDPPPAAF